MSDPPHIPFEVGSIIIHSHTLLYAKEYFLLAIEKHYGQAPGYISTSSYDEMPYSYSDLHFEMPVSFVSLSFIKTTSKNKSINGKLFVFFLTNLQNTNKQLQLAIRHLIDSSLHNCVFIFPVEKLTGVDRGIITRSCIINLVKNQREPDIVLMMDNAILSFLQKGKSLKPLDCITQCRELAYRLFHVNCPLSRLCKHIINFFSEDENIVYDVIKDLCDLEAKRNGIHKDILLYEQVLFMTVSKYIPLMNMKPKRKSATTTAVKAMTKDISKIAIVEVENKKDEQPPAPDRILKKISIKLKKPSST